MTDLLSNIGDLIVDSPLLAYIAVFFGGVLSSANPCVIITIPLVIGYVGGYAGDSRPRAFLYTAVFILGLSTTFTFLGLIAGLLGTLFGDVGPFWRFVVAAVAIGMGLQLLGVTKFSFRAVSIGQTNIKGIVGSFVLGLLFGLVSSPCATPVLAVILAYVASKGNAAYGASLLFVYALGHCILMLAAGTFTGIARHLIESKGASRFSTIAKKVGGVTVILVGLYILFFPST